MKIYIYIYKDAFLVWTDYCRLLVQYQVYTTIQYIDTYLRLRVQTLLLVLFPMYNFSMCKYHFIYIYYTAHYGAIVLIYKKIISISSH